MFDHLIYGAIGFLLGGILGGALVGRIVTDDMKKRMDEIEDQNRRLVDEINELRGEKREAKEKKIEKLEKETKLDHYESIRKRYVSSYEDDEDSEEDTESDSDDIDDEEDKADKIKRISEQQFNEEINYRDHESLTYYQQDGTLVDSGREIVTKEETVVGSEIMDMIDDTTNDFLYAFDEDIDKLYEISIEHDESYMRDVLGVPD